MSDFNKIFSDTLKYEGGYDDSMKADGVVSNYGITQSLYDAYNKQNSIPSKDVRKISYGEARDIAQNEFYNKIGGDKITYKPVKSVLFDYAYNSGVPTAVSALQNIVGAKADGIVGSKTLKKLDKYIEDYGENNLIKELLNEREKYLTNLVITNPKKHQQHYQGWMNRINDLRQKYLQ